MCSLCLATVVHDGSQLWLSLTGHTAVRLSVVDDLAVIQASGTFDNGAITPCRAALDAATSSPGPIVLDLRAVDPPVRVSVALVGAMRRYSRVRGTTLMLADLDATWVDALATAGVSRWYDASSIAQLRDFR